MTVFTKEEIEELGVQIFVQRASDKQPRRVVMPHTVDVDNNVVKMWVPKVDTPDDLLDKDKKVDKTPVDMDGEAPADNLELKTVKGKVTVLTPQGDVLSKGLEDETA